MSPLRAPVGPGAVRPVLTKYTWEPEYQRVLLDAALRLPPEAGEGGGGR